MLFALHREYNGKLFPNQLYHNLQSTFINFFFCASKYKIYHPDEPLYSMLLGSDILERLFGNYRLKKGVNSLDALELISTTQAITKCEEMLESHPRWGSNSGKVMNHLSLDYSKPSNWNSDTLILRDVDIKRMWSTGCVEVERMLQNVSKFNRDSFDFVSLSRSNKIILLKPFGKDKIGLKNS